MPLHWLHDELQQRRSLGLFRSISVATHTSDSEIEIDGKRLVNFGANDYLGLASHPNLIAVVNAPTEPGCEVNRWGSGASPLVSGYGPNHAALEYEIAKFENTEAAILFSTGYAANVGTVAALATSQDIIFSDELNHASLIDGCRLSRAKICIYPHADIDILRALLREHRKTARRAFLVTDSLFSMDGDIAPLDSIVELADEYDFVTIIDEAHATVVYGQHGRGVSELFGVEDRIPVRIGTLSKAIGSLGGFVAGSQILIDYLRNFARTYVYSTAMPAGMSRAAIAGLRLAHQMHNERQQLQRTSIQLRKSLTGIGLSVPMGDSPIIPVYLGDAETTVQLSLELRNQGHFVPAIRPPTVPQEKSLLRISLSISHTEKQIASLLTCINHRPELQP